MKFYVVDEKGTEIAAAYKRVDAIWNKEYFERKGMKNLKIIRK